MLAASALVAATCSSSTTATHPTASPPGSTSPSTGPPSIGDIHKIKHVVIIMQENRSFDSYFGTYPGADGIPMQRGIPTVCNHDPRTQQCQRPYHDPKEVNFGGPHSAGAAMKDINGGLMDGFLKEAPKGTSKACAKNPTDPTCQLNPGGSPDVMGWHDAREIPNYWTYAKDFVLQDHMFEPNLG